MKLRLRFVLGLVGMTCTPVAMFVVLVFRVITTVDFSSAIAIGLVEIWVASGSITVYLLLSGHWKMVEIEIRADPPMGLENLSASTRFWLESKKKPEMGSDFRYRSQTFYVTAKNGDLVDCEIRIVIGTFEDHLLWQGITTMAPNSIAKEKMTIARGDNKMFTLWYAMRDHGKESLYIPITLQPHEPREIGKSINPIIGKLWFHAQGFSEKKPHPFAIYRETFETIKGQLS